MADDAGARLPRGPERQFGRESRRGALQRDPTVWYEMRDSAPSQRTPRETGTTVGVGVVPSANCANSEKNDGRGLHPIRRRPSGRLPKPRHMNGKKAWCGG